MKYFSPPQVSHDETKRDEEGKVWLSKVLDAKNELGNFVTMRRRGGRVTQYVGFLNGTSNVSLRYKFSDGGPDAIIRFPKPGHIFTAFRDEKLVNEVQVMEFLRQKTTIPIPRVHSWGLTSESPRQLGPFIIMDYVYGTTLSTFMKQRMESNQDEADIQDSVLDKLYTQIADFHLQLSQLTFPRIGAISKDSCQWSVSKRPLTRNMNDLATISEYPVDTFPVSAFNSASDYFKSVAQEHFTHLGAARNLGDDERIARARLFARHQLAELIPKYCTGDSGPFLPFCDDLQPSNMVVNPKTLEIIAVLDFGFTNAMPGQFTYDPPWWLLLSGPEVYLNQGSVEDIQHLYEPRMEQYLRALESVEQDAIHEVGDESAPPLSTRMRDSWASGRFWFNYAARKSSSIDAVYWAALHDGNAGIELLENEAPPASMEVLGVTKSAQLGKVFKEDRGVCLIQATG